MNLNQDQNKPAVSPESNLLIELNRVLSEVLADARYEQNLDWGEPRPGHPEGTVRTHIMELEENLAKLRPKLSNVEVAKLRILIHVHDTFKREAKSGVPISDPHSHASLARSFLDEFCSDPDLLAMVQYHDEPFALWRQVKSKGLLNQSRWEALVRNIQDWDLFVAFNIVDGCTAGKRRDPLHWLLGQVVDHVEIRWKTADLL